MLISYKHKFIFIHNYKVAGTSVKHALRPYSFNSPLRFDRLNSVTESIKLLKFINRGLAMKIKFLPSYTPHGRARELKQQIPEAIWEDFYKFGFVRNPWDWQVSQYHYMRQLKAHFQSQIINKIDTFEEYINWRVNEDLHLQKDYFYDKEGNLLVDFVGKLETINKDFDTICKTLGIDAKLEQINTSKHRNYRSYYSDKARQLIDKYFEEDIKLFGYSF